MRILKLALISVVVLFGLLTLMAAFLPSHVRISRAIDINAGREKIYPTIADLRQWETWNEYVRVYHNKKYSEAQFMADEMKVIINKKTDSLITFTWLQPSGNTYYCGFSLIAHDNNHTTVQWYFDFQLKWYPWEKFQSIVYDEQLGPLMENSLTNLKRIAENSK